MSTTTAPKALSPTDVAKRFGIHPNTVRNLIASGELPAYRIGRSIRINTDDLDKYMASTRVRSDLA